MSRVYLCLLLFIAILQCGNQESLPSNDSSSKAGTDESKTDNEEVKMTKAAVQEDQDNIPVSKSPKKGNLNERDVKDQSTERHVKNKSTEPDVNDKSTERDVTDKSTEQDVKDKTTKQDVKDKTTERDVKDKSSEPRVKKNLKKKIRRSSPLDPLTEARDSISNTVSKGMNGVKAMADSAYNFFRDAVGKIF